MKYRNSKQLERCWLIRLHPAEWQSGDAIWIIDAVGESKAVQQCIEALTKTTFKAKEFKMLQAPKS